MNAVIDWTIVAPRFRHEAQEAVQAVRALLGSAPMLSGEFNDDTYGRAIELYESLLAVLPDEEETGLTEEMQALVWFEEHLGKAIANYANQRWPLEEPPGGTPAAIIRTLMDQHGLTQSELPEIGSQGVVSEVLRGKRQLNLRQIRAVSARFGVPQRFFLED